MLQWRSPAPACGHHGCWHGWTEPWATAPNLVTAVRTLACVALAVAGAVTQSPALLVAGLLCYWVGDVADGALARRLGQETRQGAALDVVTDRVCSLAFWVPWAVLHPAVQGPVALYVLEFAVVDGVLSLLWLAWPLLSCNYVDRVHPLVHRLNWWPPAKVVNTAGVVVLVVVWPQPVLAVAFLVVMLAVKATSLVLLVRALPAPEPGCAAVAPGWAPSRVPVP